MTDFRKAGFFCFVLVLVTAAYPIRAIADDQVVQDRMCKLAGPHPVQSLSELDNLLELHPKSPDLYVQRGQAYFIDGDADTALANFKKALAVDPDYAPAHIGISRVMQVTRRYDEAFAELEKAERSSDRDLATSALWESAYLHRECKQFDIALKQFDQVLKRGLVGKQRQAFAFYQRAQLYVKMRQIDKGAADFTAAIALNPTETVFYFERAGTYIQLQNLKGALADLTYAIDMEKKRPSQGLMGGMSGHLDELYRMRFVVYGKLGQKDLAQRDLQALNERQNQQLRSMPFRLTK